MEKTIVTVKVGQIWTNSNGSKEYIVQEVQKTGEKTALVYYRDVAYPQHTASTFDLDDFVTRFDLMKACEPPLIVNGGNDTEHPWLYTIPVASTLLDAAIFHVAQDRPIETGGIENLTIAEARKLNKEIEQHIIKMGVLKRRLIEVRDGLTL